MKGKNHFCCTEGYPRTIEIHGSEVSISQGFGVVDFFMDYLACCLLQRFLNNFLFSMKMKQINTDWKTKVGINKEFISWIKTHLIIRVKCLPHNLADGT